MNNIRSSQLFSLLLICAAFTFLCQTAAYTMEGIFGAAIAATVGLLLCLPIALLYHRGFSLERYVQHHKLLPLAFIAYLLVRGGVSFVRLQQSTDALSLPIHGKFLAAALIALVCLYTAGLGIRALARSSTLIMGILLLALGVMLLGALPQAKPQNLSMTPTDTIWQGFLRGMYTADEVPLFFLLLDFCGHKRFQTAISVFVGKFLLMSYLTLLGMAVLGSRMQEASHPFFAVIAVSQPLSTQRADALFLLVFVMLCVIRITLFSVLSAHLLQLVIPKLKYTGAICLGLMLAISAAAAAFPIAGWWHIPVLGILGLLIPLGFLLAQQQKGKQS